MCAFKQLVSEYDSIFKEIFEKLENKKGELRFNRPIVAPSDVAQQYFCEKKVEMTYIHGKIDTETKRLGTEAHESMLEGSERVGRDELLEEIFSGKPVLALEFPLMTRYRNVVLVGRTDCVAFQNKEPIILFDYKFSNIRAPFRDHYVQARIYCLILNGMGFKT